VALWWHSFIPLACAECDDSLPFSGTSSIPLCYVLFPATLLHQLFFHPLSPHLTIYFSVYLSILMFPNSYIILFWEFYFLPFSVHVQTNVIFEVRHLRCVELKFNGWQSASITTIFIISYGVESIAKIITICNYTFRPYQPSSGCKYYL
jgi:hypothetical protein